MYFQMVQGKIKHKTFPSRILNNVVLSPDWLKSKLSICNVYIENVQY